MMVQKFENGSIYDNRLFVKSRRSVFVVWDVQLWQMTWAAPFGVPDNVFRVSALIVPLDQPKSYMDGVMNDVRASPEPLFRNLLGQE